MQYQHLVFEEFARTISPRIDGFRDFDPTINPAIVAEFAHTVFRFGHSMLDEQVDRLDPNFVSSDLGLIDRKSTCLNSSHLGISYAVFCLNKNSANSSG